MFPTPIPANTSKEGKVTVLLTDITPVGRQDVGWTEIVNAHLSQMVADLDIRIHSLPRSFPVSNPVPSEIERAIHNLGADLMVWGQYVTSDTHFCPLIHIETRAQIGRACWKADENADLSPQAVEILKFIAGTEDLFSIPASALYTDVRPLWEVQTFTAQNEFAHELTYMAVFLRALRHYNAGDFEKALEYVGSIMEEFRLENWPSYWSPPQFPFLLRGLCLLHLGETHAAIADLNIAAGRSMVEKLRVQKMSERILNMMGVPDPSDMDDLEDEEEGDPACASQDEAEAQPQETEASAPPAEEAAQG